MPVRNLLYDALQYTAQVENIVRQNQAKWQQDRESKGAEATASNEMQAYDEVAELQHKPSSGEYLSGFYKDDRIIPVITLTLHFGAEKWDGPMSLREMFTLEDPEILSFVTDYRLNLLSPASMTDEELNRFTTSLREVMLFIKYSNDKAKLNEMLQKDKGFKNLDKRAANVISMVTGSKFEVKEEEEDVNMCKAIQEMLDDATWAGKQEGKQDERTAVAMRMLEKEKFSYEEIADLANLSIDEIQELDRKRKVPAGE